MPAGLKGRPWGSVGCFSLQGQFSDQAPIVDGSPLRDRFSLFMRLSDGSAVGGWYGAGLDRDNPPIVGLGSEGDHELLAPSLDGLLAKLTSQQFDNAWSDLKPHDEVECQTVELAQWLTGRPTGETAAADNHPSELPDFRGFMERWSREREDYWANHRLMAELGWRLAAHLPQGQERLGQDAFRGRDRRQAVRGARPVARAAAVRGSRLDRIPAARSA
ncbi:hypothetical protein ACVWXL_003320 [Bradyrhizobium sp. GM22.5]